MSASKKKKEPLKDTEVLVMARAYSRERVNRIREKLKEGTKKISFAAKFEGKLVVRPDTEYQNWAAICPWRVLVTLSLTGLSSSRIRKAMKKVLEEKDSLSQQFVLDLKRAAEEICRGAVSPPMKKQRGTVTFEGIVTKL
jgi:hypothetical protein